LRPLDPLRIRFIVVGIISTVPTTADTIRVKIKMSVVDRHLPKPSPDDSAAPGAGLTVSLQAVHALGRFATRVPHAG